MTQQKQIRAKALGVIQHEGRLLVFEGYDLVKDETFYRPLGGGIEFGETGAQALAREMREEIGAEVTSLRYLGLSENMFTCNGEAGHEIVLLYEVELVDRTLYGRDDLQVVEPGGVTFRALWKPLADFADGRVPLYPDGLLNLLTGNRHAP
jgi:NADH pyrophosphatase NudC (nudix superfamily)